MYPIYDLKSENDWLRKIAKWCRKQEHYITSQLKDNDHPPEQKNQLTRWSKRFQTMRERVENSNPATFQGHTRIHVPPTATYLLQQSHQLHYHFSRFLQNQFLHRNSDVMTVSYSDDHKPEQGEYAGVDGEQDEKMNLHPIPIGEHTLPPLPYPYNALEPYIDEKTMRLHHDKHHRSYVEGLNKAEKEMEKARRSGDFSLIKHWEREAAFNGAGHYLHTIFWHNMTPKGGGKATGAIAREINRIFGGFQPFKQHFSAAAEKVEGVGWALLVWAPRAHRVEILQAEKHQNLSQQDVIPLLVLDVWEHAYYLKYNNDRKKYINAWWHVVNWDDVNERFLEARRVRWKPF